MASHPVLSLLFLAITVSTTLGQRAGGLSPIPNPGTNKMVQDLGSFAVVEYNKGHPNATLTFIKVLEAQRQVVAGMNYYLKLSANYTNNLVAMFNAVVFEPLEIDGAKELTSFTPAV